LAACAPYSAPSLKPTLSQLLNYSTLLAIDDLGSELTPYQDAYWSQCQSCFRCFGLDPFADSSSGMLSSFSHSSVALSSSTSTASHPKKAARPITPPQAVAAGFVLANSGPCRKAATKTTPSKDQAVTKAKRTVDELLLPTAGSGCSAAAAAFGPWSDVATSSPRAQEPPFKMSCVFQDSYAASFFHGSKARLSFASHV
jgi:hypothetical protein